MLMCRTIAILCSGQGTQHAGMFDLVSQAPEARPILEAAREVLGGQEPVEFVHEATPTTLFSNRTGQIVCCAQALAAWAIIRPRLTGQVVLAGYSVGELAAWGCAGLLTPAETLRLAVARAETIDAVGGQGSGLAALMGLRRTKVDELCRAHDAHVAIINGDSFFIVGGTQEALQAIREEAQRVGATSATILKVAVASHTPPLAEASRRFGEALARLPLPDQVADGIRLLSGVDGETVFSVLDGRSKLAAQISHTLQWAACLDGCRAARAEAVLELGPGRALANMASQFLPGAQIRSMDDFRTPEGLLAWLRACLES